MRLDHTESFQELCRLSAEPEGHLDFIDMYARYCEMDAAAGKPCVALGTPDYALVRFICDDWKEEAALALVRVFSAYVRHGIIQPNKKLVMRADNVPTLYNQVNAMRPLEAAVLVATLPVAEQLVLHGADVTGTFDGLDFFEFVRKSYGEMSPFDYSEEQRAVAAAQLSKAYMQRQAGIAAPAYACASGAPTPRRQRRMV